MALYSDSWTEKEVIAFGNYLLSDERFRSASVNNQRSVTDADLLNWKTPADWDKAIAPSTFQPGDKVDVIFTEANAFRNGLVTKVHFGSGHVSYDVEVVLYNVITADPIEVPIKAHYGKLEVEKHVGRAAVRLYNVREAYVQSSANGKQ